MSDKAQERVSLGAISGAQGIRGEVIIRSFTEIPENVGAYGPLTNSEGTVTFDLKVLRSSKKGIIARIKGVDSRNKAEELKGTELFVLASLLPEPDDDAIYYRDLTGLKVVDEADSLIGEITSVQNFGAGDLLEIKFAGSEQTEFLPFHDDYIIDISLENGKIIINPPVGLWD